MMLYNLLQEYRACLLKSHTDATAETYYKRLCTLFEGQSLTDTVNRLDIQKVLDKLGLIKNKNYFSQAKNAFLHFCEFQDIKLSDDTLKHIEKLEKSTCKKYRKFEEVEYAKIDSKIKHIQNKKLKMSFQIMSATGLRVSELAGIAPKDTAITDDAVTFRFIAKGGERDEVTLLKSEYPKLFESIKEDTANTQTDKKLFYSAVYLQNRAKNLGFKCHDLRRAYAKLEYRRCKSKDEVMKKLRHSSIKNTNIYLRSRIKI